MAKKSHIIQECKKLRKRVIKNSKNYFHENGHLFGVIYLPIIIVSLVSLGRMNWTFMDKLIDVSFIMFGVFVIAITLSGKKDLKKKMLTLAYIYFVSALLLLVNSSIVKIDGKMTGANLQFLISLIGGLILFIVGLHKTFKLLEEAIGAK